MIRKSVQRFSEKIMLKQKLKRDDNSTQSHRALVNECDDVGKGRTRGAVAVHLVRMVGIAERNAAHHAAIVAETKVTTDQAGMARQRGLRDGAEPERLRRQHEVGDIGAA